jgi:AcrR family transcriptional regulator
MKRSVAAKTEKAISKRENREGELIDAAVKVFYEKGYAGAAIQEIADVLGVLKGSLYYYIDTKEDLLFRICESVDRESREILDEVQRMEVRALERIRIYIERHVRWYLENTEVVGVFFRDWRYLTGPRLAKVAEHRRGYDRTIRAMIGDAQASGEIDASVDTKYASFYILAAVNSVPVWYRPNGRDSAQAISETYAGLTVATLTGSPGVPPARKARTKVKVKAK